MFFINNVINMPGIKYSIKGSACVNPDLATSGAMNRAIVVNIRSPYVIFRFIFSLSIFQYIHSISDV